MARTRAGEMLEKHRLFYKEHHKDGERGFVCKTVMFKRRNGEKVAVMIPLTERVSYRKLKAYFGEDCAPLSPDELRAEGFEPGEVAPMLVQCELLVDPSCERELVHTGSGTLEWGTEWKFSDLQKLKKYILVDVRQ